MNDKNKRKINQETVDALKVSVEELDKKFTNLDALFQELAKKHGSIKDYYKEIFGEDGKSGLKNEIATVLQTAKTIKEHTDEFDFFWNGDDENLSFNDCKQTIIDTHTKAEDLLKKISESEKLLQVQNKTIVDFTTKYQETLDVKLKEVETIKKDLQDYRDQVVGGSLFKAYEKRTEKNDILSESYGKYSIWCLLGSALLMGVLLVSSFFCEPNKINYILPSSMSVILLTASFVCSSKSKIYHKLAEEYAHKATLLQSFVGYREQYKQTLDDEEYNQFFREVIEAVKVNASERIDKLLHFKWPFEKAIDSVNKGIDKASSTIKNTVKTKDDDNVTSSSN